MANVDRKKSTFLSKVTSFASRDFLALCADILAFSRFIKLYLDANEDD